MTSQRTESESPKKETSIPIQQWEMPASFSADGSHMVSLREVVDPGVPTMSLSQLTPEQRAELVAKRIELQPKFELGMIGAGVVDKERAIAEVKAKSPVGRTLIEIEQRLLNRLIQEAAKQR